MAVTCLYTPKMYLDDTPWDDDSDQYTYLSSMPSSTHSKRFMLLSQSPLPPLLSSIPPAPRYPPAISPAQLYDHLQVEAQRQEQFSTALRDLVLLEQDFLSELKSIWVNERSSLYQLAGRRQSETLSTSGSNRHSFWKLKPSVASTVIRPESVECIFAGLEKVLFWHEALLGAWKAIHTPLELYEYEVDTKGMSCHLNYARNHLEAMLTVESLCRKSSKAALILDNEEFLARLTRPLEYLTRLVEFVDRMLAYSHVNRSTQTTPRLWIEFVEGLRSTQLDVRRALDGFQPYLEVLDVQAQFDQLPGTPLTSDPKRRLICDGHVFRRRRANMSGKLLPLNKHELNDATETWFLFNDLFIRAKQLPNERLKWKESAQVSSMVVYSITPSADHNLQHGITLSIAGRTEDLIAQFSTEQEKNRWLDAFTASTGQRPKRRSHISGYSAGELVELTGALIVGGGGGMIPFKHKSESTSNLTKFAPKGILHQRKGSVPSVNRFSQNSSGRHSMQSDRSSNGRRYVYHAQDDELYGGAKASVDSFGMWSARPM